MRGCARKACTAPADPPLAFTPERLRDALAGALAATAVEPAGYCVALSGGLDSSVLLAALAAAPLRAPLRAIHVDHHLHPDAAHWARHSVELAVRLGVACEVVRVQARPEPGESPEAAARAARYDALGRLLRPSEVLLTAHHGDDQLETVLLQWLRGGGLRALAGMPAVGRFADRGWHARPLLGFTRAELQDWAVSQRLEWLEDPSNLDPRFDRNYLRLEVLPALRRRWPAAAVTVGRVAAQAAEAISLDDDAGSADLAAVLEGRTIKLGGLAPLGPARQRRVLRAWLRALELPVPSAATLEALRRDMLAAAADRVPETRWPGAVVRRYRGRLHADPTPEPSLRLGESGAVPWRPGETLDLGALGWLELKPGCGRGLRRGGFAESLVVGSRPSGGRFRPSGVTHRRDLRKWLQERGVLPWMRGSLPVVTAGAEIVAVGDLGYGGTLAARPGEEAWVIEWHGRPVLTESEALAARLPVAAEGRFR
jgi:tRNA(Ile)-lysidine synthase